MLSLAEMRRAEVSQRRMWEPKQQWFYLFWAVLNFIDKMIFFYHLFLAVLGLRCCVRAFSKLWRAGAILLCSAQSSHCSSFSCCGARALGTWAQQLWLTGSQAQAQ